MIEDIDGGDIGPSRAPIVRAISVVLAFSAIIGWAAVSSTAFRGPFATPHPSANAAAVLANAAPRYTPMPFVSIEPAAIAGGPGAGCVIPGGLTTTYVFVNGGPVTIVRPAPTSASTSCATIFLSSQRTLGTPLDRILPLDRVAR